MTTPTGSLEPNALIHDRYRVSRQIGRGGMGAVYEAVDTRLGNTVALKQTLVRGEQLDEAFAREARLLSGLRHAALPVVSDYFAHGDSHFLVMQYIPGTDLGALMSQRSAPFAFGEVLPWADSLLDALDYLHTQSPPIIHRDIKPQNLKLTPRGEIVLLDFGLAKGGVPSADATRAGASLYGYTPQYAPLEQIQASGTDPRSDLYSLGATLYALLTNQAPLNALDRASAVLQGQPDPLAPLDQANPQIPAAVARLIARCMALNASERPASAAAARAELASAVRTGSAGASTAGMATIMQQAPTIPQASPRPAAPASFQPGLPPPPAPPPAPQPARPRWIVPALVLGLAVTLCAVIGGAIAMLAAGFSELNPDGPPPATTAISQIPPPARSPIVEFDPSEVAATAIAVPTIELPNVDATVAAVQTQVAESIGGIVIPGQQPSGDSLGTVLLEFGAEGTGDGFLSDSRSVAVGPDGAIYVADYSTGRIQRFSAEGQFERSWKLEDDRPILAMAADRAGLVYVSQNAQISVFEGVSGTLLRTITDGNGDGFDAMALLGDGTLLGIPWAGSDVVQIDTDGQELGRISDIMANADSDASPGALAADGLGSIYLLDGDSQEVYVFSAEGKFRDKFSAPGTWAFSTIAVDGQGRIYVTGFPGGVAVYSPQGQPVGNISVPGVAFDLAFDDENNLYVSTNTPRVIKLAISPPQ